MIEELQQEIAKLKQKLANVQQQVIEAWSDLAREQEDHEWTKYHEYGGSQPGPIDGQGCHDDEEDEGAGESGAVGCDECGRMIGRDDPYCHYCEHA